MAHDTYIWIFMHGTWSMEQFFIKRKYQPINKQIDMQNRERRSERNRNEK